MLTSKNMNVYNRDTLRLTGSIKCFDHIIFCMSCTTANLNDVHVISLVYNYVYIYIKLRVIYETDHSKPIDGYLLLHSISEEGCRAYVRSSIIV